MNENVTEQTQSSFFLLEYNHKVMEARRSISFKAFLSLVALELVLLKGFFDYKNKLANDGDVYKGLLIVGFVILCFLFVCFIIQIEKKNRFNRERYISLEEAIWDLTGLKRPRHQEESRTEGGWKSFCHSWAGTWTALTIILLTIGCCLIVWKC